MTIALGIALTLIFAYLLGGLALEQRAVRRRRRRQRAYGRRLTMRTRGRRWG